MVTRIIDERISDGQFDECDLTLRDLERIRSAFVEQLLGMYHTRIAYPQNKVVELESRRARPAAAGGARAARGGRRRDGGAGLLVGPVADRSSTMRDGVDRRARVVRRRRSPRSLAAQRSTRPVHRRPASIGADPVRRRGARRPERGPHGQRRADGRASFPLLPPRRSVRIRAGAAAATAPPFALPPRPRPHLGDIVVSVERAIEQAETGRGGQTGDVRWSAADELRLLVDPRHPAHLRLGSRRARRRKRRCAALERRLLPADPA